MNTFRSVTRKFDKGFDFCSPGGWKRMRSEEKQK